MTVVLDTNLTPALVREGNLREIVSKVQTMRKEAGFEVTDHILLRYESETLAELFAEPSLAADVLADRVERGTGGEFVKEWSINGHKVTISVSKLS